MEKDEFDEMYTRVLGSIMGGVVLIITMLGLNRPRH